MMLAGATDWDRDREILNLVKYQAEMICFRLRIIESQLSDLPARPDFTTPAEDLLLRAASHCDSLGEQLRVLYRAYRAKPVSE